MVCRSYFLPRVCSMFFEKVVLVSLCPEASKIEGWIQLFEATLYLNGPRWSECDEKKVCTCGVHASTESGALGSLAEGRRAEVDWPGPGQAVVVHIQSPEAVRWDPTGREKALQTGVDAGRARGDLQRDCGRIVAARDCRLSGSFAFYGQPRGRAQRRACSLSCSRRG